ncbi:protein kinase [Streptomyces sp. NPDC006733]|uniref:serine/threonine-protein kinase n=1 Tax=Streptomyces sp. NPDC006733 TaxID=3155460 RepID=UPI0033CB12BB
MWAEQILVEGETTSEGQGPARSLLADRYRLDAVIGLGGMGQVWRGWDELLERAVAVKVVHDLGREAEAAERFALEARTAAQLNDPHVVGVYDFGTDRDRFFLVMELIEGCSLAQELQRTTMLEPARAVALCAQVAAGLAVAHQHGVVHRDIKPGNLLLEQGGRVAIADFGIARFTQDTTTAGALTADGHVMGTVAYLAPERALGRPATPAADLYALGCALYQLLTGTVPFAADLAPAILYQHVHADPVPPQERRPEIPASLSQYVLRLLAKDPAERPTAAQAMVWLRQWTPDADGPRTAGPGATAAPRRAPVTAAATRSAPVAVRPRARTRRVLVAGAALVVLGGAAAGGILAASAGADAPDPLPASPRPVAAASHPTATPAHPASGAPRSSPVASSRPSLLPSASAATPPVTITAPAVDPPATVPDHNKKSKESKKPKEPKKPKKPKA